MSEACNFCGGSLTAKADRKESLEYFKKQLREVTKHSRESEKFNHNLITIAINFNSSYQSGTDFDEKRVRNAFEENIKIIKENYDKRK